LGSSPSWERKIALERSGGGGGGRGEGNFAKKIQTRRSGRKTKYNCKAMFKTLFNHEEKIGMGEVRKAAVWSTYKNKHRES